MRATRSPAGRRTISICSSSSGDAAPGSTSSARKTSMYSRVKPGVVQKPPSRVHVPPVRPHSSCSSRLAVASGSSPASRVPAGISRSVPRVASRSWRTNAISPTVSTDTIATAPGCSTISRSRSPQRSTVTAMSRPCQTTSDASGCTRALDECERDLDHALQVGDADVLVRRVDVRHTVGEIHTAQAPLVERVRVGRAAGERVAYRIAGPLQRACRETDDVVALREAIAAVLLAQRRRHLALRGGGCERARVEHLLHEVVQPALVVAACLREERAPLRDDVPGGPAGDEPTFAVASS